MASNNLNRNRCRSLVLLVGAISLVSSADAQPARIGGFVTDHADGQALEGATVALYAAIQGYSGAPEYGTATSGEGVYLVSGIEAGRYLLQISFVGYEAYRDTLALADGDVRSISVSLRPVEETLDEVLIEAERLHGAARITAGHQRIRPEEIELIPSPDISADLANYLTTLPGVVTTGDRGGQFFIRGGEPSQNLVMLDGIIIYQPFHVLSFYSAFPAEVIDRVDFYAGGFGAKYSGRLSSVIDVSARPGNNRRFAGMASGSPFSTALRLEGPIVPGHASFLISARESFIHRTGKKLYGQDMPFEFGDVFAKVQAVPGSRDRLAAAYFSTHDRGTLTIEIGDEEAQEVRWSNSGGSFRWLMLPRSMPVAAELTLSQSRHEMQQGLPGDTVRSTEVRNTRIALDATFPEGAFFGGRSTTIAGWDAVFGHASNALGGLFQEFEGRDIAVSTFGLYVEPDITIGAGLRIRPGIRVQSYNVRHAPYFEPRLRVVWERGIHHVSGAMGLYHQHMVGLSDRRDAASVFTIWTGIPRQDSELEERVGEDVLRGRIGSASHAVLGYRSSPVGWLEYSVEAFYKRNANLFVGEWTALPRFSTRLQTATGRSFGFELRAELRRRPFYGYITYGLTNTLYAADGKAITLWYGKEQLRYRPSHDRRHQVNALVSTSLRGFDMSLRWQFGSGLPYTRPLAFDGFALVDDIKTAYELEHSRRVIYERPFGSILPTYHRLDASIERTVRFQRAALTLQLSAINTYNRRNIFYVDLFTLERQDQLPFVPSAGLKIAFD